MTFLTTLGAIWLFTSIFFMLYCIGRDIYQFVKKQNKRLEKAKRMMYPLNISNYIEGERPITKLSKELSEDLYKRQENEIAALKGKYDIQVIKIATLETCLKDRERINKRLEEDNRNLDQRNTDVFNLLRDSREQTNAAKSRIKDLEAALARAEGLNRSFADGGVVSAASIKPKDIHL